MCFSDFEHHVDFQLSHKIIFFAEIFFHILERNCIGIPGNTQKIQPGVGVSMLFRNLQTEYMNSRKQKTLRIASRDLGSFLFLQRETSSWAYSWVEQLAAGRAITAGCAPRSGCSWSFVSQCLKNNLVAVLAAVLAVVLAAAARRLSAASYKN